MDKNYFQNIHYSRIKPNHCLNLALSAAQFFYKIAINFKNFIYKIGILKEKKVNAYVICIGNLTTGGVGKTPIVSLLANSMDKKTAIVSRGYKAKLDNSKPNIIKGYEGPLFKDGTLCGDEPFELSKKAKENVIVVTSSNRLKGAEFAIENYGSEIIILDDGFSNRTIKKDKAYIVIDSKMRFGNNELLPKGPLREPIEELKRADEIILVDKADDNFESSYVWASSLSKKYQLKLNVARIVPKKVYSINESKIEEDKAIAFCAIGQPKQFFDFAKSFYGIVKEIEFDDHYSYTKEDIKNIIKVADDLNIKTFITTKKDEAKLIPFLNEFMDYSLNVLELGVSIEAT